MSKFGFSMLWIAILFCPRSQAPANAQAPASVPDSFVLDVLLVDKEVVPGRIVEVGESGAMRVAADGGEFELRLLNVALPPAGSAPGMAAVNLLRERLLAQPVEVHIVTRPEEPDLAIGYPKLKGVDVRRSLVEAALARYCSGDAAEPELEVLEQAARAKGKGIWSSVEKESVPACPGAA